MKQRETKQIRKNLGFVLIDFEEECFSILTLFYLSKKHVLLTCNKILLNITVKKHRSAKCDIYNNLWCKVCSQIVYGAKCNLVDSLWW